MLFFENHTSAATSDPKSVNIIDRKGPLHSYEFEEPNLIIKFEPFVLNHFKDNAFEEDIITSSFLKELVTTSFDNANEN